jgi:hypothetical protein
MFGLCLHAYEILCVLHHVSSCLVIFPVLPPHCTNILHIPAARLGSWWPQDGTGKKIRSFSQALDFSDKNNTPIPPTKVRPGVSLHWVCHSLHGSLFFPFSNFLVSQKSIEIWWYPMLARLRCIIHTIPCIAISYHIDTWKCRQIALKNPAGPMACLHRRTLAACPALGIEGNRMNDGWIMLAWFENVRYLRGGAQTMVGCTVSTTFTF